MKFLQTSPFAKYFDLIAELDVYHPRVQGGKTIMNALTRVLKWREKLYKIVGRRLLPACKAIMTMEDMERLCADRRFDWVGIGSHIAENDIKDLEIQKQVIRWGHTYGKKVHGYAFTRLQTDFKLLYSYDSVDSTTWLRADKYGGTFIFLPRTHHLIILSHLVKEQRRSYSAYFKEIGLDISRIMGEHRDHSATCTRQDIMLVDEDDTGKCMACKDQLEELRASSLIAWRGLINKYRWVKPRKFTNFANTESRQTDGFGTGSRTVQQAPDHGGAVGKRNFPSYQGSYRDSYHRGYPTAGQGQGSSNYSQRPGSNGGRLPSYERDSTDCGPGTPGDRGLQQLQGSLRVDAERPTCGDQPGGRGSSRRKRRGSGSRS